jgi:transmembrane sensor
MSDSGDRSRRLLTREAAEWFLANRAGLDASQREAFSTWLRASPRHMEEYLGVAVIASELASTCIDDRPVEEIKRSVRGEHDAEGIVRLQQPRRRVAAPRVLAVAASVLVIAGVAIATLALRNSRSVISPPLAAKAPVLRLATGHREPLDERLQDRSLIHLDTDSAASISYDPSQRLVVLTRGQADFEVARDPTRPFRVIAGAAEVTAHGTNFDVRLSEAGAVITVVEGRVLVQPAPMRKPLGTPAAVEGARIPLELNPGQQISVSGTHWPPTIASVDAKQTTAWLHRQITFDDEPLAVIVREFNCFSAKPIEITTPSLRRLRVSGIFATDDVEAFIAFLRHLKGVRVEVTDTQILVSAQ